MGFISGFKTKTKVVRMGEDSTVEMGTLQRVTKAITIPANNPLDDTSLSKRADGLLKFNLHVSTELRVKSVTRN
jgi:hypothetical protein